MSIAARTTPAKASRAAPPLVSGRKPPNRLNCVTLFHIPSIPPIASLSYCEWLQHAEFYGERKQLPSGNSEIYLGSATARSPTGGDEGVSHVECVPHARSTSTRLSLRKPRGRTSRLTD